MPPEDQPIGTWSGATREEILLLFGALFLIVALAFAIRAVRRWTVRRREMHSFFSIVDSRNLDEREEEVVRGLAMDAGIRRPTEVLTSLATFDSLAEGSLRKAMRGADRDLVRRRMESLYSARLKLFPEARSWDRNAPLEEEKPDTPSDPSREVPTRS